MALAQREKRMLTVLGVVLAIVVLLAGGKLLHHGGAKQATGGSTVGAQPQQPPAPSPRPTGRPDRLAVPAFQGVDPFKGISPPPPPSPSPSPSVDTSPSPSPTWSSSPAPSVSQAPSTTVIGGHTVTLLDVFNQSGTDEVVVLVDGSVYTVKAGDQFGDGFKVVSIAGSCASLSWHDQGFDLCAPGG